MKSRQRSTVILTLQNKGLENSHVPDKNSFLLCWHVSVRDILGIRNQEYVVYFVEAYKNMFEMNFFKDGLQKQKEN